MNESRREELRSLLRAMVQERPERLDSNWDETLGGILSARFSADEASVNDALRERAMQRMRDAAAPTKSKVETEASNGHLTGLALLVSRIGGKRQPGKPALIGGFALAGIALILLIVILVGRMKSNQTIVKERPAPGSQQHVPNKSPKPDQGPLATKTASPEQKSPVRQDHHNKLAPNRRTPHLSPTPDRQEGRVTARIEIGKAGNVVGAPTITLSGQDKGSPLRPGDTLYADSVIETGDADKLEITLPDGSSLALNFNSTVVVHSLGSSSSRPVTVPNTRGYEIELDKGHVWATVKHLGPTDRFAIETPVATAVALGTEFGVRLRDLAESQLGAKPTLEATLSVLEGRVGWSNNHGSVEATSMTQSVATAGAAPSEPKRLRVIGSESVQPGLAMTVTTDRTSIGSASMHISTGEYGAMRLVADLGWVGLAADDVVHVDPMGSPDQAARLSRQVRVVRVLPGSPAAAAGVKVGDQILTVNSKAAHRALDLDMAVWFGAGKQLALKVRRESGEQVVSVEAVPSWNIGERPFDLAPAEQRLALDNVTYLLLSGESAPAEQGLLRLQNSTTAAAAHNSLGVLYETQEHYGRAIKQYQAAIALSPKTALYHYNLGIALRNIGNQGRSVQEFETAARLAPEWLEARIKVVAGLILLKQYPEAKDILDKTPAADPKESEIWMMRLSLAARTGNYPEAISAGEKSAELEPGLAAAYFNQGSIYFIQALRNPSHKIELLDQGIAALRKSIDLDPGLRSAYIRLGDSLIEHRQLDQARGVFELARRLFPTDDRPYGGLGRVASHHEEYGQAEEYFRKAIALGSNDPNSFGALADMQANQGKTAEAIPSYEKLLRIEPSDLLSILGLSVCLRTDNQLDKALAVLKRGIAINPSFEGLWEQLGVVHRYMGRLEEAEKASRKSIELGPTHMEAYDNLSKVLRMENRLDEAVAVAKEDVAKGPDRWEAHQVLFDALVQAGHSDEAVVTAEEALKMWPTATQFRERLCLLLSKNGKRREAVDLLQIALRASPGDPTLKRQLAWFESEHDAKLDERLLAALRDADVKPNDPLALDSMAAAMIEHGEVNQAVNALTRAIKLADEDKRLDARLLVHLGAAYEKANNRAAAASAYRKAAKADPANAEARDALKRLGG
ncbi:MAG: tetratricopeptide repeat protein [Fimbriimonadales bacterium]